jgi:hypothetical protein
MQSLNVIVCEPVFAEIKVKILHKISKCFCENMPTDSLYHRP